MNRKYLMIASAIVMGIIGLLLLFMPGETFILLGQPTIDVLLPFMQLAGSLYLGFAILNWMAKTILIGGIYAKPLSLGNFTHFLIGGLTLIKMAMDGNPTSIFIWVLTVFYIVFAVAFGFISFKSPKLQVKN